ncbi:helix-turn-helix domain-containing protein [Bacillus firmus]|uniref:helix-turn-helix domain-containing protein n=1 Tax=Cytobacillus firmus TaxID=1399 RepID=UPI0015808B54|nr:helix-turn-helix domain-containing protein [Cytobacillus firmus]NUH86388.1 helix-turn-helix domain-containing protein [Cytobacillus firmus]
MNESENFGTTIRQLRKDQKMTLKELSEKSGISFSQIAKIEKSIHTPPRDTVIKLARGLSTDENTLLSMVGFNPTVNKGPIDGPTEDRMVNIYKTFMKYKFTCQICGSKAPKTQITIDTIIPIKKGGSFHEDNLIVLCANCHLAREAFIRKDGLENDIFFRKKDKLQ